MNIYLLLFDEEGKFKSRFIYTVPELIDCFSSNKPNNLSFDFNADDDGFATLHIQFTTFNQYYITIEGYEPTVITLFKELLSKCYTLD